MNRLAFCSSPRFVEHDTGPQHPERPDRIRVIHQAVRDAGLLQSPNPFPNVRFDLDIARGSTTSMIEIEPTPAEERWLLAVHPKEYIQRVKNACAMRKSLDEDTPCGPKSFDTALLSAGAALRCCDAVVTGTATRAFAAIRPPGHHAEPDRPMGFCLFSNIAIAARYLQQQHNVERVAIVDFDVHHGNGTQSAFEADPSVLFISLHQSPQTCYPGTGFDWEIGTGKGRGYTINLPFDPGADDHDYLRVMETRVVPELDEFRPQVLLISAGFDAHRDDPLAQISLSEEGFELMTRSLVDVVNQHCGGKIVSVLEGGYNLRALGRSVVKHLEALST
jgi:acetoin utilization deacetylase AcuC-like enzyme